MFKVFKKIYDKAGVNKKKIKVAMLLQFVENFFSFVPLGALFFFYQSYMEGTITKSLPLILLLMLVLGVVLRIFTRYYMDKNVFATMYYLYHKERIEISSHLKKVNMGFFTDDNIGRVTTTLVNGLSFIEEKSMDSLVNVFAAIANLAVVAIFLMVIDFKIGLIYFLTILTVVIFLIPYQKLSVSSSRKHNEANKTLTSAIIEYVRNISVVKAFNLIGKHKRSNDAFVLRRKVDLESEKINIPFLVGAMAIMAMSTAFIIYYSLANYQAAPVYTTITIAIISFYIYNGLTTTVLKLGIINIASDTLSDIDSLYNEKVLPIEKDEKPADHSIEFKDVEFKYNTKNVINGISFKLQENTMNALVGLSGSGKTTLVNLIPRFFDVQKGSILIGGVNVKDMSEETLFSCISMVFQNVYLFKDTIYNNIAFGSSDASEEKIIEACKKARCYDFIMNLKDGFNTMVGEAGLSLSGGERQRISIARAILKDAPIILLDEATASVDPDNEAEIQEAINALVKDKTILVIAHKLSCVKNADKILVIDDGKLIQEGKHLELIEQDGLYSSLWKKRTNSKSWKILN